MNQVAKKQDMAQESAPVHKNVYTALAAAQAEMGPLIKGATNPHFKSKYADLADLVTAVREPLTRNGLAYFHQIVRHDGGSDMRTVLMHGESETSIECDVPLLVAQNHMQGMKSATTYAKRIGLESVSGVAPEDDDGNAATQNAPKKSGPEKAAIDVAVISLGNASDTDQLRAIWVGLPAEVKAVPSVIEAKNARKAVLTAQPAKQPAEIDDEIPEFN